MVKLFKYMESMGKLEGVLLAVLTGLFLRGYLGFGEYMKAEPSESLTFSSLAMAFMTALLVTKTFREVKDRFRESE